MEYPPRSRTAFRQNGDLILGYSSGHKTSWQDYVNLEEGAGAGVTGGTGTIYKNSIERLGGLIRTTITLDITGLHSMNTDGDIIGVDATTSPCHIGKVTEKANGTLIWGRVMCLEAPTGGDPNINLYSATESTGVENGAIGDLTETLLLDRSGDWAINDIRSLTALPAADQYLYLTQGDATGTDADYTAGKFLIELMGY